MADGKTAARRSDLGARAITALIIVVVSGAALWFGGWFWNIFVAIVAVGVMLEWSALVERFARSAVGRFVWLIGGVLYIGIAALTMTILRNNLPNGLAGFQATLALIAPVVFTDIGAYFAGRSIGGPKIAPRISPSKTWAGLFGGMVGAAAGLTLVLMGAHLQAAMTVDWGELGPTIVIAGILIAIVAQAGDFFESWMKRAAGVKDSGAMLPGHGGMFDRVDGLLAVAFMTGLAMIVSLVSLLASGAPLLPTPV